ADGEQSKSSPNKADNDPPTTDIHELIQRDPRPWFKNLDLDQAIADFDKALQLNPLLRNAHYNRGLAFSEKGDEARARADFEKENNYIPTTTLSPIIRTMLQAQQSVAKRTRMSARIVRKIRVTRSAVVS